MHREAILKQKTTLRLPVGLLASILILSGALSTAQAAPGDLDRSFGDKGKVTAPQGSAGDLAVQPDGKIVAAGSSLVRYLSSGALDTGFGTNGEVVTGLPVTGVTVQSDGKIVVIGTMQTLVGGSWDQNFFLLRYTTTGTVDSSFGSSGQVTIDFGGMDEASDIVIQADGKIIAVGRRNLDAALARLNLDGSFDQAFGSYGKVVTPGGVTSSAAIQLDGKIVVAGTLDGRFAAVRYLSGGSLDGSFGVNGTAIGPSGGGGYLAIQSDGKIIVAGTTGAQQGDFAMTRFNSNGSVDSAFGSAGLVSTDFFGDSEYLEGVAVQGDGKIILAGTSYYLDYRGGWTNPIWDFAVARYNPNGSLDSTFGSDRNGKVTTNVIWFDNAGALLIQPDGKIIVGGSTSDNRLKGDLSGKYALVRYLP